MTETVVQEQSIRVLKFSGLKKDWQVWKQQYEARAAAKDMLEALETPWEQIPLDREVLDENVPAEKERIELRKKNKKVFNDLTLSMDGSTRAGRLALKNLKRSKLPGYESGNASDAWRRLKLKYESHSVPTQSKLEESFYSATCSPRTDPEDYITYMEELRIRIHESGAEHISDTRLINRILNSLPPLYSSVIEALEDRVGDPNDPLEIDELEEKLKLKYERNGGGKYSDSRRPHEGQQDTVLFTTGMKNNQKKFAGAMFKGKCYHCGKHGHKGADCRSKKQNEKPHENGRANGKEVRCFYCNQIGHIKPDCPKRLNEQNKMSFNGNERALQMLESGQANATFEDFILYGEENSVARMPTNRVSERELGDRRLLRAYAQGMHDGIGLINDGTSEISDDEHLFDSVATVDQDDDRKITATKHEIVEGVVEEFAKRARTEARDEDDAMDDRDDAYASIEPMSVDSFNFKIDDLERTSIDVDDISSVKTDDIKDICKMVDDKMKSKAEADYRKIENMEIVIYPNDEESMTIVEFDKTIATRDIHPVGMTTAN